MPNPMTCYDTPNDTFNAMPNGAPNETSTDTSKARPMLPLTQSADYTTMPSDQLPLQLCRCAVLATSGSDALI